MNEASSDITEFLILLIEKIIYCRKTDGEEEFLLLRGSWLERKLSN